jgi:uncharacterized protein (TIGR02246 family)
MRNLPFYAGLMLVSFVVCLVANLSPATLAEEPGTPTIKPVASQDEATFRASAAEYVKAFNAADAKAIAARWTEDGDYVNEQGKRYVGRSAIQKEYEAFFAQYPGVQIQTKVDSVRMLSPETAIVEGTATLGNISSASPVSSHYMIIQVKKGNQWYVASARDVRVDVVSTFDRFADFEKLIGSWNYQKEQTQVAMTCRWIANKKFMERSYTVSENGTVSMSGKQIIGWNPVEQKITSWLFDSNGGHDFAIWTPQKKGWVSQSSGHTGDGAATTALNVLTHVDDDTMTWKSFNRTLEGEPLADSGELTIKRVSTTGSGR